MDRTCHPLPFRTLLCILIILVLALAAPASAAVWTINPGDSIQTAINSSASGDTIILNPGTYNQNEIMIFKNISIQANTSMGGSAADTIIDAARAGRIFNNSEGHSLAIDNLTLKNGYNSGNGGAIYTKNGGTLTITSSTFSNCSATSRGGAIDATSSTLNITSSTFSNCSADGGGAIFSSGSTLSITSSTFSNCSAKSYGGAIVASGTVTVTSSTFSTCSATNGE
ncbi:MAG: hypothetical protein LUO98_04410, partial [Methanoregula sp.]|nr:hypothetical protein [Methanoregula sp.]